MAESHWYHRSVPKRVARCAKAIVPEGVWWACPGCQATLYRAELEENLRVCPQCQYHDYISARKRITHFLDDGVADELSVDLAPTDFLKFQDNRNYDQRLSSAQKATGEKDALVVVKGTLLGLPVVVAVFEYAFIGGSMGRIVGTKFVHAATCALDERRPLISFSASGGARMQEGLVSLLQMARTSAAIARLNKAAVPYISILTNPTMGGVSASLAMLGDINIAEPGALIGFAGPRVIEQTVRETLPEGFQRAEFLQQHGALDQVIARTQMRTRVGKLLKLLLHHT